MLLKKPSGFVFSSLSFHSPFLVLFPFSLIIRVRVLLPIILQSLPVPNISIFAIISFATILPKVFFARTGYPLPTCLRIFLPNLFLIRYSLSTAPLLVLSLFDYFIFPFTFFSVLFSLPPDGGVLEYQDITAVTLSVM